MYRLFIAALLSAGFAQTVSALEAQPRVIGGQDVTTSRPWMAEVEISRSGNPSYAATLCGGTLIAPQWVLTAAHCIRSGQEDLSPEILFVSLGHVDRTATPPERHAVSEVRVHEHYQAATFKNDLALLKLSAVSRFSPLDLAKPDTFRSLASGPHDEALEVLGWGTTSSTDYALADTLQMAALDYVPAERCAQAWDGLDRSQLCAGEMNPSPELQDSCRGDSGGPLVYRQGDSQWLVGVTSYGHEYCATSGVPGVYSRVDHFLSWLEKSTSGKLQDLKIRGSLGTHYLPLALPLALPVQISNNSLVSDAQQLGLRVSHEAGVKVSVSGMRCQSSAGETLCYGDESLAAGGLSSSYTLSLSATGLWAGQLDIQPLSDGHDYFRGAVELLDVVFSDEPDVVLSLSSEKLAERKVRVTAQVRNASTQHAAARVRVNFVVPEGWQAASVPDSCQGERELLCELGDLQTEQSRSQSLVLEGEGDAAMTVSVWTDNGDFPADDNSGSVRLAQARSAVTESAPAKNMVASGGGGGGSLPAGALLALLLLAARRIYQ